MKLISDEKVKEYAISESGKFTSIDEYTNGLMVGIDFGIEKGVYFAEQELQNLAIEFQGWLVDRYYLYELNWVDKHKNIFTPKELFSKFLEQRNK